MNESRMSEAPSDTPTFEAAIARLEQIVQRLEKGELTLEESLQLYEEGVRLSRLCHAKLEEAEGKIEMLVKDARGDLALDREGKPRRAPFVPAAAPAKGEDEPNG